ncbi:hypothetical protein I6N90_04240 [Paenibacillus sp. GSMTC-2017]|uniref:hypothetical protein n=1 Tax=Paenibacillus sp. GSMTC-2017 TaxID=2794350 RepID=UPI0018D751AF|nr:hypothetical protein [Paenibacillus sp. GSMTC-2017]MBH5317016.1 hypothetical protein [Paenibacillus sp. GSMTC-2017]
MESKVTGSQVRSQLIQLFQDAGYELPELIVFIESLEQKNILLEQEISKLKSASARRVTTTSTMNTRLMDALRE